MAKRKKPSDDDQPPLDADRYLSANTWKGAYQEELDRQRRSQRQCSKEVVLGYEMFRQAVSASALHNERPLWQHACEALGDSGQPISALLRFMAKREKDIDDFLVGGNILLWTVNFKEHAQKGIKALEVKNLGYFADELQRILEAYELSGLEQFAAERIKTRESGIA